MISVVVINLLCSYKVSFLITYVSIKSAACKIKFSLRKILNSAGEDCNRNIFDESFYFSCMSLTLKD